LVFDALEPAEQELDAHSLELAEAVMLVSGQDASVDFLVRAYVEDQSVGRHLEQHGEQHVLPLIAEHRQLRDMRLQLAQQLEHLRRVTQHVFVVFAARQDRQWNGGRLRG